MKFTLPELTYSKDALMPHMSVETLEYHYGKHHNAYVVNLNNLIPGTAHENKSLEEIILSSEGAIFNNAAQIWNHTFFWNSLTPKSNGAPTGPALELINKTWGDFEKFKTEFTKSAVSNFGSGWTWLVKNKDGALSIVNTSNAQTPLTSGLIPLLTVDVWEHAYYIDYRNERPKFLNSFWALANWDFVNKNLK